MRAKTSGPSLETLGYSQEPQRAFFFGGVGTSGILVTCQHPGASSLYLPTPAPARPQYSGEDSKRHRESVALGLGGLLVVYLF